MQQFVVPFQVGPVLSEYVQFWASFAAQTATQDAFNVVSDVYGALWHMASRYDTYQRMQQVFSYGDMHSGYMWADSLMLNLRAEIACWQHALRMFETIVDARTAQWFQEVEHKLSFALALREQVARMIIQWCEQQGVSYPQYTQAFLAAQANK